MRKAPRNGRFPAATDTSAQRLRLWTRLGRPTTSQPNTGCWEPAVNSQAEPQAEFPTRKAEVGASLHGWAGLSAVGAELSAVGGAERGRGGAERGWAGRSAVGGAERGWGGAERGGRG